MTARYLHINLTYVGGGIHRVGRRPRAAVPYLTPNRARQARMAAIVVRFVGLGSPGDDIAMHEGGVVRGIKAMRHGLASASMFAQPG